LIEITTVEPFHSTNNEPVRAESESLIRTRFGSYLSDESGLGPGNASIFFLPNNELQVAQFLKEMNAKKIPVTVSGGRTGIVGGAVPEGGALLSLERMSQIRGIRWDEKSLEWRMIVQPGIRLRDLQERIATKNLGATTNHVDWHDLSRFLGDRNPYFYPPDPTEESASIGGTVATDASGARTYFYGRTRDHVRAIRVVLANGEVLALRRGENVADSSNIVCLHHADGTTTDFPLPTYDRPTVKCATGFYSTPNMDLLDLFIGSEGTLGVITLVEIALKQRPETAMLLAFFPSIHDAINFVIQLRSLRKDNKSLPIHSMEYLDSNSLRLLQNINEDQKLGMTLPHLPAAILTEFEYKDAEEAIQLLISPLESHHSPLENTISGIDEGDKERLRTLRHAIPEAINSIIAKRKNDIPGLHKLGTDTAVPDDKLADLMMLYHRKLEGSRLEHYVFGHVAENHLHVNILPRSISELRDGEQLVRDLAQDAVALGGTISAEHGIGKLKRDFMQFMYNEAEIREMRSTKSALDPNWILSQGNMFT